MSKVFATRRAGDIMIPIDEYPYIHYTATIHDAVEKMRASTIIVKDCQSLPRAVLVMDDDHQILGILRRRDIFRGLEPKFLRTMSRNNRRELFDLQIDPSLADLSSGSFTKAVQTQAKQSVTEIMSRITDTLDFTDNLAKIVYIMLTKDVDLLPILKERKVVGVVRSVDAFNEIAEIVHQDASSNE
ncbi:MAG: CBS domain-containing protein [Calditrichaeota bacterium]|nr:CBS domain-containing protein [Calditrichota bacterium]